MKIACVGLVGESVFMEVPSFHVGEETISAYSMFDEPGGKGFNQAVAAARAGASVSFLGAIGSDHYRSNIEEFCRREHIDCVLPQKKGRTAYAVIQTNQDGRNHVTVYRGADLEVTDVERFSSKIAEAAILLLNNEVPNEINIACAEIAARNKTKIIMNPAPRRNIPDAVRKKVFLFTPNEYEADGLEDCDNCIVTMGQNGCIIRSTNQHIPAESVIPVDTTGAGDTFTGVLAVMLSEEASLLDAATIATRAAAIAVTRRGAASAIPYRSEYIQKMAADGKKCRRIRNNETGR